MEAKGIAIRNSLRSGAILYDTQISLPTRIWRRPQQATRLVTDHIVHERRFINIHAQFIHVHASAAKPSTSLGADASSINSIHFYQ